MKLYMRRGHEHRGPAPMSDFITAWVDFLDMDEWAAREGFAENLAYGEIYEYRAEDEKGEDNPALAKPSVFVKPSGDPTTGCICPPTSEQTCMNAKCPRKPAPPEYCGPFITPHPSSEPKYSRASMLARFNQ